MNVKKKKKISERSSKKTPSDIHFGLVRLDSFLSLFCPILFQVNWIRFNQCFMIKY